MLLLTEAGATGECPAARAAADLQDEFGPWLSWVGLLSGHFTAADVERIREPSPLRLERLYHDRGGALRAALGIGRLPALLLVDGDGAVHEVCSAAAAGTRLPQLAATVRALATASRGRRAGFDDFRLPRVGAPGLVSFLEAAGSESTIVSFVHSSCLPCARQLEVLDFVRDRHAGQVAFVAVFLDSAPDSRIRGFVAAAGVAPDFVLRDPELQLAGRYSVDAVPALLVIDGQGRIALSRSGYREEERDGLYRDLDAALTAGALTAAAPGPALSEARRIHEEACAYLREGRPEFALLYLERVREMLPQYHSVNLRIAEAALAAGDRALAIRSLARYLAAEPLSYGSADVREAIAGLLAPTR